MTKTVFSPEETDEIKQLRAELQDAQNDAATEVATDGKAAEKTDDRIAGIPQQIRDITEAD
jgi:hypothetical protein